MFGNVTCAASTKRVLESTGGFRDKLTRGRFGEVRVGVNYLSFQRELFQGTVAGVADNLAFAPKRNESAVTTSFRYDPFQ